MHHERPRSAFLRFLTRVPADANLEDLEKKLAEMNNMIKTAVLGGASTKSTKW